MNDDGSMTDHNKDYSFATRRVRIVIMRTVEMKVTLLHHYMVMTYMIFVLFSPQAQFFAHFFSTQKRVNRDKTDFATKQRKL